jgi:hypothetical protein
MIGSYVPFYLAYLYHYCSFAVTFPPISLSIWNLVPINVSINQGSGVCLSTA